MQRISSVVPEQAQGEAKELLKAAEKQFGMIPNSAKVMANSPAVLGIFLYLAKTMSSAKIGGKLHHQINLAASEMNATEYCTSILNHLCANGGMSACEIADSRKAESSDLRTAEALRFAAAVLETRGKVSDAEIEAIRNAGFDETEIVEIVASVVVSCFANFLNNVAQTALDIPQAPPVKACAVSAA